MAEQDFYAPISWENCNLNFTDIIYDKADGIAKITINRPQVRNAFRPQTVNEMMQALNDARYDDKIGVIILTGQGDLAFCSGGDQSIRGNSGYKDEAGGHHLNVLDFQRQIRTCPKPIIAMVAGYAVGGGHVLHMMCDLTIAADNAVFGQTGPRVGSFDAGYGSTLLARIVGHKKAREIWYLCRQYSAEQALDMGLVNTVVPLAQLEQVFVGYDEKLCVVVHCSCRSRSCPPIHHCHLTKDLAGAQIDDDVVLEGAGRGPAHPEAAHLDRAAARLADDGVVQHHVGI